MPTVMSVHAHIASIGAVRGRRQVKRSKICCASCGAEHAVRKCGFWVLRGGGVGASLGGGAGTYVTYVMRWRAQQPRKAICQGRKRATRRMRSIERMVFLSVSAFLLVIVV